MSKYVLATTICISLFFFSLTRKKKKKSPDVPFHSTTAFTISKGKDKQARLPLEEGGIQ